VHSNTHEHEHTHIHTNMSKLRQLFFKFYIGHRLRFSA